MDQHDYKPLDYATHIYYRVLAEDGTDRSLEEWFPEIPDEDIESIRPALDYTYSRLDDDPLWVNEYSVE